MFERFTDHCRRAMALANQEAVARRNESITAQHVLLGLLDDQGGGAAAILAMLVHDASQLREELESAIGVGEVQVGDGRRSTAKDAKRLVADAIDQARSRRDKVIGTEHLLLGLLRNSKTAAAQALAKRGISATAVGEMLSRLDQREA